MIEILAAIGILLSQAPVQEARGVITGQVFRADGRPAAGVEVWVRATADGLILASPRTDGDGRYRVEVRPGNYYLSAPLGNSGAQTFYPGVTRAADAAPVTLTDSAALTGIDIRDPRPSGFRVSGRVIRDPRQVVTALPWVQLVDDRPTLGPAFASLIASDGSFEFLNVPPGPYRVAPIPATAGWFINGGRLTIDDRDVDGLMLNIPFTIDRPGRVVVQGDYPLLNQFFSLTLNNGTPPAYASARLLADGTFTIALPEGEYQAVPSDYDAPYRLVSLTYGGTDLLKSRLAVHADDTQELVLTLAVQEPPRVSVSGRVIGASNLPQGAPEVRLAGPMGMWSAPIGTDESFVFPRVRPGTYEATVGPTRLGARTILVGNEDLSGLELIVPATTRVTARIIVEDGGPVPLFSVIFRKVSENPDPNPIRMSAGRASPIRPMALLPDGEYRVALLGLREDIYEVKSMSYGAVNLLDAPLNTAQPQNAEILVTLSPRQPEWRKVSGRVAGAETLRQIAVNAPEYDPPRISLYGQNGLTFDLESPLATDGSFEFPHVLPGTYRANLIPSYAGAATIPVEVGNADVRMGDLVVPAHARIPGRVVVEGGGPAPPFVLGYTIFSLASGSVFFHRSSRDFMPDTFELVLPYGVYGLVANTEFPYHKLKSVMYGTTDLLKEPLRVGPGLAASDRIVVTFERLRPLQGGRVSGRVVREPGDVLPTRLILGGQNPIDGSWIYYYARIQPDGAFELPSVFVGTYTAWVHPLSLDRVSSTVITVDGDLRDVPVAVRRLAPLAGRIVVPAGNVFDITQILVEARRNNGVSSARVQPDGRFKITSEEGAQTVSVTGLPASYTLRSVSYGGAELQKGDLILSRDDPFGSEIVITLNGPAQQQD